MEQYGLAWRKSADSTHAIKGRQGGRDPPWFNVEWRFLTLVVIVKVEEIGPGNESFKTLEQILFWLGLVENWQSMKQSLRYVFLLVETNQF